MLYGHPAAVCWILDEGADPNLRNDNGSTPLHFVHTVAAADARAQIAAALMEAGADDRVEGRSALWVGAQPARVLLQGLEGVGGRTVRRDEVATSEGGGAAGDGGGAGAVKGSGAVGSAVGERGGVAARGCGWVGVWVEWVLQALGCRDDGVAAVGDTFGDALGASKGGEGGTFTPPRPRRGMSLLAPQRGVSHPARLEKPNVAYRYIPLHTVAYRASRSRYIPLHTVTRQARLEKPRLERVGSLLAFGDLVRSHLVRTYVSYHYVRYKYGSLLAFGDLECISRRERPHHLHAHTRIRARACTRARTHTAAISLC